MNTQQKSSRLHGISNFIFGRSDANVPVEQPLIVKESKDKDEDDTKVEANPETTVETIVETIETKSEIKSIQFKSLTNYTFRCPITHEYFRCAVIAEDGNMYERFAIENWFKTRNASPLTNLVIGTKLTKNIIFDNMLKDFYESYPEFKPIDYSYLVQLIKEKNYEKEKVKEYLEAIDYMNVNRIISKYKDDNHNNLTYLFDQGKELINFIIDHHDINFKGYYDYQLIHLVCRFGSIDMLKRIIDRGVNCKAMTNTNEGPIHYICSKATRLRGKDQYEAIKLLVMNNVDVNCKNNNNRSPLVYLCDVNDHFLTKEYMFDAIQLLINAGAATTDLKIILTKKRAEEIK